MGMPKDGVRGSMKKRTNGSETTELGKEKKAASIAKRKGTGGGGQRPALKRFSKHVIGKKKGSGGCGTPSRAYLVFRREQTL